MPQFTEFVHHWRTELETRPPQGVPAHITVMYPFLPPKLVEEHSEQIADVVARQKSFEFDLSTVGWFGDDLVYLVPQPAERFTALTRSITTTWPDLKPYGGAYEEVVPHLTLAMSDEGLERAALAAEELLPARAIAREVWLMEGCADPPVWRVVRRYKMGSG